MTNTSRSEILASEILAHLVTDERALAAGDLAVFTDYKCRKVGCRVLRVFAAGEITTEAQIECRIIGDQNPYPSGMALVLDAVKFQRAI